jgi:molybdenum cofactor cytidylyltransferase
LTIGEVITTGALLRALTHADGGQKNIPITARKTILLNQADTEELQSAAHGMADDLLSTFHSVVIASLAQKKIMAVHEPVAGIILAAGEAKRYGQTKQLLNWNGQPFVRAVAKTALEAGLTPVIVVVGANADQVQAGVDDLGVKVIINHDWKSGQASSIKEGVKAIFPAHSSRIENGAAIFLLADQPHITTSILRALMERHAESLHPIVAPMVLDRRANPVLFDRVTFPDLMKLEGDVGGRAIFHQHTVEYLPWHDDRLLLDVDTPEQYQRLISDDIL